MTQEQAEEMVSQLQQQDAKALEQIPTLIPEDLELKEGLSVTVSILIEKANDVLVVPNSAITYLRGEAYVQVVLPDGEIEERLIQTGIRNWQYTGVIDGLSEGEQVVVPQATSADTLTPPEQRFQRPQGGMAPGMGGVHP